LEGYRSLMRCSSIVYGRHRAKYDILAALQWPAPHAGQLTQNLAAAQLVLTPDERARLDQVSSIAPPYPHSFLANLKHDPALTVVS